MCAPLQEGSVTGTPLLPIRFAPYHSAFVSPDGTLTMWLAKDGRFLLVTRPPKDAVPLGKLGWLLPAFDAYCLGTRSLHELMLTLRGLAPPESTILVCDGIALHVTSVHPAADT